MIVPAATGVFLAKLAPLTKPSAVSNGSAVTANVTVGRPGPVAVIVHLPACVFRVTFTEALPLMLVRTWPLAGFRSTRLAGFAVKVTGTLATLPAVSTTCTTKSCSGEPTGAACPLPETNCKVRGAPEPAPTIFRMRLFPESAT